MVASALPRYHFDGMAALKPELGAAATKDAIAEAGKFAADVGTRLGDIRKGEEPDFVILAREDATQSDLYPDARENERTVWKVVRAIARVEFTLGN